MKISVEDFEEILEVELSTDARKFVIDNNFEYEFANPEEHNLGLKKFMTRTTF